MADEQITIEEVQQIVEAAAAAVEDAADKPARKPRGRKPKAAVAAEAAAEAVAEAVTEAAPAAEAPAAEAAPAEAGEAAPAKTRKPRGRKPVNAGAAPEAEAAPAADQAAPEAEAAPAPEAAPAADAPAAGEAPAAAAAGEAAKSGKPGKRRGRPAKKVSTGTAEAAPAAPVEGSAEGAAPAEGAAEAAASAEAKPEAKTEAKPEGKNQDRPSRRDRRQERQDRQRGHQRGQARGEVAPSLSAADLEEEDADALFARAEALGLDVAGMERPELVQAIVAAVARQEGFLEVEGILDLMADGYGFLRTSGYLPGENDIYMPTPLIRRNGLRRGDKVAGVTRPARENEKFAALQKVVTVNGIPVEELGVRVKFADLTPVYPDERLMMEHGKNALTARVIDLTAPIGKGQRGLIVSPPKAGKTTVLKDIAASITANNPEVHLMCLLVDERPEEVTDMERSIHGEVISSTFDMPCENHIAVAELVIERAKRLVENGADVVILLDSITRLARAYNLGTPASGRILSGGVDSSALYPPKRFLGAARNIENGGSLTILASALIETGSKMDEVIFEEFKGTGNMELKLDRQLANRRIFPAIDPINSGTRKEELLIDSQWAPFIWGVRDVLSKTNDVERAMDMLIKAMKQTDTNEEFLLRSAKKMKYATGNQAIEL